MDEWTYNPVCSSIPNPQGFGCSQMVVQGEDLWAGIQIHTQIMSTPVHNMSPSLPTPRHDQRSSIQSICHYGIFTYQRLSINLYIWKAGCLAVVAISALVSGKSRCSLFAEPSLLPRPFCAWSQWIWRKLGKKLSDIHRIMIMENSLWYGCLWWAFVWW